MAPQSAPQTRHVQGRRPRSLRYRTYEYAAGTSAADIIATIDTPNASFVGSSAAATAISPPVTNVKPARRCVARHTDSLSSVQGVRMPIHQFDRNIALVRRALRKSSKLRGKTLLVVDDINLEKGKVKVLVSFFGRETPVELDFLQVQRL